MPEAPAQTDAVVTAGHDLAAYLAHREVYQRAVAGLAGQACRAAQHVRWPVGQVPAKGACEEASAGLKRCKTIRGDCVSQSDVVGGLHL
jgi:hypothetical protein